MLIPRLHFHRSLLWWGNCCVDVAECQVPLRHRKVAVCQLLEGRLVMRTSVCVLVLVLELVTSALAIEVQPGFANTSQSVFPGRPQVVEQLRPHGLTLQNYASIREQSIGGFTQVRSAA